MKRKYLVLTAESATELMQKVNEAYNNGWKEQGGVAVYNSYERYFVNLEVQGTTAVTHFAQAMVKEATE